jgi:hypothetical protein
MHCHWPDRSASQGAVSVSQKTKQSGQRGQRGPAMVPVYNFFRSVTFVEPEKQVRLRLPVQHSVKEMRTSASLSRSREAKGFPCKSHDSVSLAGIGRHARTEPEVSNGGVCSVSTHAPTKLSSFHIWLRLCRPLFLGLSFHRLLFRQNNWDSGLCLRPEESQNI